MMSVPRLGDIPVLGNLFKYQKRGRSKTNLMVFLRPHIVRNAQDSAGLTLDRYNYMRAAQAGMPIRAASWLIPDATTATLPAIQRDSGTGLLDLRGMENSAPRSEEHTSELQSLMRSSYAVFCLKKKKSEYKNDIVCIEYMYRRTEK